MSISVEKVPGPALDQRGESKKLTKKLKNTTMEKVEN